MTIEAFKLNFNISGGPEKKLWGNNGGRGIYLEVFGIEYRLDRYLLKCHINCENYQSNLSIYRFLVFRHIR